MGGDAVNMQLTGYGPSAKCPLPQWEDPTTGKCYTPTALYAGAGVALLLLVLLLRR